MIEKENLYPIVGIACCGIYFAEENFNRFLREAENYLKIYQSVETECPTCNLIITEKFLHNSVCYSVQIAPRSLNNQYAIVSGTSYSIFKVLEKSPDTYQLSWNGQVYNIGLNKKTDVFQLIINQDHSMTVERLHDSTHQSSILKLPNTSNVQSEELNSVLDQCLSEFNHILQGYSLPEPFFLSNMYSQMEMIFNILRDPLLPSLQFKRYLHVHGALLPTALVHDLQQVIGQYTSNISSIFTRFPSNNIKLLVEKFVESIYDKSARLNMEVTLRPILELAEMYSNGIRGNAKYVIERLLDDYLRVEIKFQDAETNSNSNLTNQPLTIDDMISHNNLACKTKLIVTLLEFLEKFLHGIILDLKCAIQRLLTGVSGHSYSQLIPRLREVLITGEIPSYEVRRNEMEAIFLSSINGCNHFGQTNRLENLICSNSEVFEIISDFFYHKTVEIRKCAMEVYVRRAFMIYEICSFEQSQLANGQLCVLFKFSLPINNPRTNVTGYRMKRSNSYVAFVHNKATLTRKISQISRNQMSNDNVDKDDISDGELPIEDCFESDLLRQKTNDLDNDSAISIGACSLSELSAVVSEPVENECMLDISGNKSRHSPSIHSLDGLNFSSFKETTVHIRTSEESLDRLPPDRHNRHASMFCSSPPLIQIQDDTTQCDLGVMIIFDTMEEIESNLPAIKDILLIGNSITEDMEYPKYDRVIAANEYSSPLKVVLQLILRDPQLTNMVDEDVSAFFLKFCDTHSLFFNENNLLRITFLLQSMDKTIRYFTFRCRETFEEDVKLRNIDPILSFQLEINRLRNYHLERLPVPNRRMYVYIGRCKEMTTSLTAEYRMFTRCIIHHRDFQSSTSSIDYMAKEAERNLMEAMDAFDMAWVDHRANWTNSNHIFFYFQSILCINKIEELENVVRAIIFKNGRRLWSLRITQAELKMSVKLTNGLVTPIRLWVHNEGGKSLDICIYREEYQFKTDNKVLISWSSVKEGRYHGVPVDCFYSI